MGCSWVPDAGLDPSSTGVVCCFHQCFKFTDVKTEVSEKSSNLNSHSEKAVGEEQREEGENLGGLTEASELLVNSIWNVRFLGDDSLPL